MMHFNEKSSDVFKRTYEPHPTAGQSRVSDYRKEIMEKIVTKPLIKEENLEDYDLLYDVKKAAAIG